MILFFYGQNDYSLKQKLKDLKEKYKNSSKGSFDLISIEPEELTFEKFTAQVQTMALFASTRLVIVNQIFSVNKDTQDKIKNFLPQIGSSAVVVFVHIGEPDKRVGLFKVLNKPKISQHFDNIDSSELKTFIRREALKREADFTAEALLYLAQIVGPNLWQLSNEIEKLATYKAGGKIKIEDIEKLVNANISSNVFSLIDALTVGNKKKAFLELDSIIATNEPPLKVLGAINFQMRLIALIKDELERNTSSYDLARKLKTKPYPVQKSLPYAKKFSWTDLSIFYFLMCELDEGVKTGKMMPEEALKDLLLKV